MRQRGSAMLIAMLVVAIIGAVGFGVVHITIRQLRQQGSIAASSRAYEAAEAGLEFALLQYRLNKTGQLGSGPLAVDAWGAAWPSTYLERSLPDDESFLVRTTNSYQRLGALACLNTRYTTAAAWTNCDGLGGRTLLRLRPGDSVRFTPAASSSKYLYFRALAESGATGGSLIVTGYDSNGQVSGNQKVWGLATPGNPVAPQSGYTTVSTDLATAAWFTVQYVNESSTSPLLAATAVTPWANDAARDALTFSSDRYLIEVRGRAGGISGVERPLQAIVNARDNTIDGLYDYGQTALGTVDYVLSGLEIVTP